MMSANFTNLIDYLCIGHMCHDKVGENRYILGGTASYAGIAAKNLGLNVGVLTSVGADFQFFDVFKNQNIAVFNQKSEKTTVFENIYTEGGRVQYLHQRADILTKSILPNVWSNTPIVQICPIDDEVDFDLLTAFPNSLVGVTIQGWLRQWDKTGKISPKAMDWQQLAAADVVIMSDADIKGFEYAVDIMTDLGNIIVLTQGVNGATVFNKNNTHHFPSYPINEVDATGAGDVFAAAFLKQYAATKDIALSTAFAHAAASFVVEGIGIQNLEAMESINNRYVEYISKFL
jgi:sugar/nucleoside kinase (ribokinase family)